MGRTGPRHTTVSGLRDAQGTAHGVASDGLNLWVAGTTRSANYPVHKPLQGTNAGGPWDAFVTRLGQPAPAVPATSATALGVLALLLGVALIALPRRRTQR